MTPLVEDSTEDNREDTQHREVEEDRDREHNLVEEDMARKQEEQDV